MPSFANSATAKGAPSKRTKLIYVVPVDGKTWYGGIFPMCKINRLVVHHTWSLFKRSEDRHPEEAYGDTFTYTEIAAKPRYYQAMSYMFALSALLAGILFLPVSPPPLARPYIPVLTSLKTRELLKRIMPKPGTGPAPYASSALSSG